MMERKRPIASVSPFFCPFPRLFFIIICIWFVETALIALDMIRDKTVRSPKPDFLFGSFYFYFYLFFFFFGGGFLFLTRRVATPRHLFCGPSIVYVFLRFFDCCADWDQSCDGCTCFDRSAKAERLCTLSDRVYSFLYFARAHRVRHYYFKYSLIYSIKKKKKRFCLPCLTRE